MTLESRFPKTGTRQELEVCKARHLITDVIDVHGKKTRIQYMVYEDSRVMLVWKKPIHSDTYKLHVEARIEHRYPVSV